MTELPDNLTKEEIRVAIAKDVIAQIQEHSIKVTPGCYCDFETHLPLEDQRRNLREVLHKVGVCKVCVLGASFLAIARLYGTERAETINCVNHHYIIKTLQTLFTTREMQLMEGAFEGDKDQKEWVATYPDPEKRLLAMMEKVIRCEGKCSF